MFAFKLKYKETTVDHKLDTDKSYESNLVTILSAMNLLIVDGDKLSSEQQQQLAFTYSIQHAAKHSQNFYLEASMFKSNSMFWKDVAKEGDEFELRNEYERVAETLKVLRAAIKEATEFATSSNPDAETKANNLEESLSTIHSRQPSEKINLNTTTGPGKIIKKSVFELRACLPCFQFAEEFICEGGIKTLLTITRHTRGNTQAYSLRALSLALDFANGLEFVISTPGTTLELFKLIDSSTLTVQREVLKLLFVIADTGPKRVINKLMRQQNNGVSTILNCHIKLLFLKSAHLIHKHE
jgi:hypothetical protein